MHWLSFQAWHFPKRAGHCWGLKIHEIKGSVSVFVVKSSFQTNDWLIKNVFRKGISKIHKPKQSWSKLSDQWKMKRKMNLNWLQAILIQIRLQKVRAKELIGVLRRLLAQIRQRHRIIIARIHIQRMRESQKLRDLHGHLHWLQLLNVYNNHQLIRLLNMVRPQEQRLLHQTIHHLQGLSLLGKEPKYEDFYLFVVLYDKLIVRTVILFSSWILFYFNQLQYIDVSIIIDHIRLWSTAIRSYPTTVKYNQLHYRHFRSFEVEKPMLVNDLISFRFESADHQKNWVVIHCIYFEINIFL